MFYIKCNNKLGYVIEINPLWEVLQLYGVKSLPVIGYINYGVQLWCIILPYKIIIK